MNQHGVTFLEVIVVIAILMIISSMVYPRLDDWSQRQNLEKDFYAALSKIDYLKIRARVTNGAAEMTCSTVSNGGSLLVYQIFDKAQANFSIPSASGAKVIEDPVQTKPDFNILSGTTNVIVDSKVCDGSKAIFISSGQSTLINSAGTDMGRINLSIEPVKGKEKFGSYQILVHPSTGFIEKYKCVGGDANQCRELE